MKLYSLRFSLGSAFVGVVALTAVLLGAATYINTHEYVRDEIREKLRSSVAIAALSVDADAHDAFKTLDDEKSDAYVRMKTILQHVRDANSDVRYVYTFRRTTDGTIEFVLDAEDGGAGGVDGEGGGGTSVIG